MERRRTAVVGGGVAGLTAACLPACGSRQVAAVAVVSPLVMSYVLTLGSGKRLLENQLADRPGYAAYRARTSGLFPLPARRHPDPEDLRP
ncbi:hypothetical protein ACIGT4_18000 [Streptomyces sioyaensis]|uniref:hypothetical protein n=1 Tax=Streptomyces sioyaensis TaxID=67364 RepID=UPI0037D2D5A9